MDARSFTQITVNGRTYASVEEMPPDARRQYEEAMRMLADADGNGVPNVMERPGVRGTFVSHVSNRIVVNGREYDRLEDVPADLRRMIAGGLEGRGAGGGVTLHLSWTTVLAVFVTVTVVVWWIGWWG